MADGVVEELEGGDGDAATERLRLLSLLEMMLPMEGRGGDGIAEGNTLRLGWAGMDEGIFGERWVAMMERTKKGSKKQSKDKGDQQSNKDDLQQRAIARLMMR